MMKITPPVIPEYLAPFLEHCQHHKMVKNQEFIHKGDKSGSLYYLIQGSVAVILEDGEGKEVVLSYINKGGFIGEMGLFLPEPTRSVLVRTRVECEIAEISYLEFEQLLETTLSPYTKDLLFEIGRQLTERLILTSLKVSDLAFLDVTGRVASCLLQLSHEPDAMTHPDGMQIKITRQEIGKIVGCSREMVGRVLKKLEESELIVVKGKTMVILGTR